MLHVVRVDLPGGAAAVFLELLRQFPGDTDAALRGEAGQEFQGAIDPVRAFEKDGRFLPLQRLRERALPLPALHREEAAKEKRVRREATADERRDHRAGTWQDLHRDAIPDAGIHQALAGIRDPGHSRVRNVGHGPALLKLQDQLSGAGGFIVLMHAHQGLSHPQVLQQHSGVAGVLARDGVHARQASPGAFRDVTQVTDGGGDDVKLSGLQFHVGNAWGRNARGETGNFRPAGLRGPGKDLHQRVAGGNISAMKAAVPVFAFVLLLPAVSRAEMHIFTDSQGRQMTAEIIDSQDGKITVKRKDGQKFQLALETLGPVDKIFAETWIKTRAADTAKRVSEEAAKKRAAEIPAKIVAYCKEQSGKQVGNGECWTLANEAFKALGLKRPGRDLRVWGRKLDFPKEKPQPGDIVEFRSAAFPDSVTGPEHTAIVVGRGRPGHVIISEQNWSDRKIVHERNLDTTALKSGEMMFYRPQ